MVRYKSMRYLVNIATTCVLSHRRRFVDFGGRLKRFIFMLSLLTGLTICFHTGILLSLFNPEDKSNMFFRNVG
jgi:hypothetical protein